MFQSSDWSKSETLALNHKFFYPLSFFQNFFLFNLFPKMDKLKSLLLIHFGAGHII